MLDFDRPRTPVQWLIFLAATGIILSSPTGTRAFLKEVKKHIAEQGRRKSKENEAVQLSSALYYLKKRKIIKLETIGGKTTIKLTEKGRRRKLEYDVSNLRARLQAHWDGKWRSVKRETERYGIPAVPKECVDISVSMRGRNRLPVRILLYCSIREFNNR